MVVAELDEIYRSYFFVPVLSVAFGYRWGGKPERGEPSQ